MSSLIEGYNYDIFISYRQKDNKHDGWVTEFVNNLKGELESTFKEEISVYFDINPRDGLLETHDVDASLKEKLKCLIFIPIISRTYCDPKSFAWEHEFKAFVEMASKDQFGLKVKLPGGNVASRVLPVQIHDLESEDKKILENELGGHIRGIDFIYNEPGINRPLKPEDKEEKNLYRTKYNNQTNKVSNAINGIISGIKSFGPDIIKPKEYAFERKTKRAKIKSVYIGSLFLGILLIFAGIFIISKKKQTFEEIENSIAVLPFENRSNDPEQEYFCDGMTEALLNNLFLIGGLEIPGSTSSMLYKSSKLTPKEIAGKLNVNYLIEGNVIKAGDNARIIVNLLNGKSGRLIWTHSYERTISVNNLLEVHSDIAQQVARELGIQLKNETTDRMVSRKTENYESFDLFMRASTADSFDTVEVLLEKAIAIDPNFADAYAGLAMNYLWQGGHSMKLPREQVIEKAEPLINKALQLDKYSVMGHYAMASFKLLYYWDFKSVENEYEIVKKLSPSNPDMRQLFADYLLARGESNEALTLCKDAFEINKNDAWYYSELALSLFYSGDENKAVEMMRESIKLFPGNDLVLLNTMRIFVYGGKYNEVIKLYNDTYNFENQYLQIPYFKSLMGISYYKTGEVEKSDSCLKDLLEISEQTSGGSPSFFAAGVYAAMNKKEKSLQMLQRAWRNKEVEMYWLKVDPIFKSLHGDSGFESIISKVGLNF